MSVADEFAGLVEMDLTEFTVPNPTDVAAVIPSFVTITRQNARFDDVIVLRRSAALAPTARQLIGITVPVGDAVADADVATWFRFFNTDLTANTRTIPMFRFTRSGNKRYILAVTIRQGFVSLRMPASRVPNPTANPTRFFANAHDFARSQGFAAGTASYLQDANGFEVIAFPHSAVALGRNLNAGWKFEELPIRSTPVGVGLTFEGKLPGENGRPQPVVFHVEGEELFQFRPGAATAERVRVAPPPGVAVPDRWPDELKTAISATSSGTEVRVMWGDYAWFHAKRPRLDPTGFVTEIVEGRVPANTSDRTSGITGHFSSMDDGNLATGMRSIPVGTPASPVPPESIGANFVLARRLSNSGWTVDLVDGDANTGDRMVGHAGESSCIVFDPSSGAHVFYSMSMSGASGQRTGVLRHHTGFFGANPRIETLDGAGQPNPPAVPGTGRTRASVGFTPSAAVFDGALWVVYQDRTFGNLRLAVGRQQGGNLEWTFSILDGSAGWRRTSNPVSLSTMVTYDDRLSVFYIDTERWVLRHAWRQVGDTRWHYEVLDGAGGANGRIRDAMFNVRAVAAGADPTTGKATSPVYVAYVVNRPSGNNVRLATLH